MTNDQSPTVVVQQLPAPGRASWIRLRSDWEWSTSKVELSLGATAALTVAVVYVSLVLCFAVACFLTVPRNLTRVYNITLSSDDYRARVRVELQHTYEPLQVDVTCHPGGANENRTLHVFFDMNERLVVYKDIQKQVCYVRSTSGEQFQDEAKMFKALLLDTTSPNSSTRKPTVHYALLPTTNSQRESLLAARQRDFCSTAKIHWLLYLSSNEKDQDASDVGFTQAKRQWSNRVIRLDACLQTLVIHKSKGMFLL